MILGHGRAEVAAAVAEAAADGTTFAMTQRREIEAAEAFKKAVPWVEHLRFTNTGTEATMHAIRLARGFTDREVVVKFEGQYHGVHDTVMFSTAGATLRSPRRPHRPGPVAELVWHPRGGPDLGAHRAVTTTSSCWSGSSPIRAAGSPPSRRADAGQLLWDLLPRPGFLEGLAPFVRRVRVGADLRRGEDRLPDRAGRGAGGLRGHPRPGYLRQGDGEWVSGRGGRR